MIGIKGKNKRPGSFLIFVLFIAIALVPSACLNNNDKKISQILQDEPVPKKFRLHEIQERGKLIAITDYTPTDYFLYRGEIMGYQFERVKSFAEFLNVELEIKVISDLNEAFRELAHGRADLIAMGLTVTSERTRKLGFADPFMETRQILVQRKPANWRKMQTVDQIEDKLVRNTLQLTGRTVHIQEGSVYQQRLKNLSDEIGGRINVIIDADRTVEELIDAVAKGSIDFTVCDENLARLYEKFYPDLDISTPVSFHQYLAWAVKKDSDSLRMAINYWQLEFDQSLFAAYLKDKYYNNPSLGYTAKSESITIDGGHISKYDGLMKEISAKYGLDWRLLASLIYQESNFHPEVRALSGAFGLMQLMPETAALFGIDTTSSPAAQIEAGVKYIKMLDQALPDEINDPTERMKFILGSYNMGIAHVLDSRRLAKKHGKDPNIWTGHVDYYVRNKSNPKYYQDNVVRYGYAHGEETFNFVVEVLDRYGHYMNVGVN